MSEELSYQTPEGYTVFTSRFLKNRGTCCKSACVHCPFGYTVKKLGIQFKEVTEAHFTELEKILEENGQSGFEWKSFWPEHTRFILLKDQVCGLFLKNHIVIKHLFLKPYFKQQDLSKELIEAYFF